SVAATRKVADMIERMRPGATQRGLRVGWIAPANLHLTLKFLGWTNADAIAALTDRVRAGVEARKGFELGARGVGAFPTEVSARVLWVAVQDPSGALAKLAADIDLWMGELGFERETRAYAPHLTIGRVKEGKGADELLAPYRSVDFGNSLVREVV